MVGSKKALSHYNFIKEIVLAWTNKDLHWPKSLKVTPSKRKAEDEDCRVTRAKKSSEVDLASMLRSSSICTTIDKKTLDPIKGRL